MSTGPVRETAISTRSSLHRPFILGIRIMGGQAKEARKAHASIAAMTPEERAAMVLPKVRWESVVWGGLG